MHICHVKNFESKSYIILIASEICIIVASLLASRSPVVKGFEEFKTSLKDFDSVIKKNLKPAHELYLSFIKIEMLIYSLVTEILEDFSFFSL